MRRHTSATRERVIPPTLILYTVNLIIGLVVSQFCALYMTHETFHIWHLSVELVSMVCLGYIMIDVGMEFEINKDQLPSYGIDFIVALITAVVPWLLVTVYYVFVLPDPLQFKQGLIAALFSAPTSAGVLFSLLEAVGLKDTWLFQKARILAVFDDVDTLLLMLPLEMLAVGFQLQAALEIVIMMVLLIVGWLKLHQLHLPSSWKWILFYSISVTLLCETLHYVTDNHFEIDAIDLEVLLPAFVIGCLIHHEDDIMHSKIEIKNPNEGTVVVQEVPKLGTIPPLGAKHGSVDTTERVGVIISALFLVCVGLTVPPIFNNDVDKSSQMSAGEIVLHVAAVTILMILGKMIPAFCYSNDASVQMRLALALGMCPRGEVGAGVIIVSIKLGITGSAVTISVISLALNLILSGFFILGVKKLVRLPENRFDGISLRNLATPLLRSN